MYPKRYLMSKNEPGETASLIMARFSPSLLTAIYFIILCVNSNRHFLLVVVKLWRYIVLSIVCIVLSVFYRVRPDRCVDRFIVIVQTTLTNLGLNRYSFLIVLVAYHNNNNDNDNDNENDNDKNDICFDYRFEREIIVKKRWSTMPSCGETLSICRK